MNLISAKQDVELAKRVAGAAGRDAMISSGRTFDGLLNQLLSDVVAYIFMSLWIRISRACWHALLLMVSALRCNLLGHCFATVSLAPSISRPGTLTLFLARASGDFGRTHADTS